MLFTSQLSVVLILLVTYTKAQECTGLPTPEFLRLRLQSVLINEGGEGGGLVITVQDGPFYTCQVQGTTMGTYQELSVILTYTTNSVPPATEARQFEMDCITVGADTDWDYRSNSLSDVMDASVDYSSIGTSTNCISCTSSADNDNHCQAPCSLTCDAAGEDVNDDCTGCVVTNICEADNPCANGGSCNLNVPPSDYTCACTNNFDGTDCTVCSLSCPTGYGNNSDCSQCIVSDICEADNPCKNGGTCNLDTAPQDYTCYCANNFTADTDCTECSLSCPIGYSNNSDCSQCIVSDICEADNPCQNGGTCSLDAAPQDYTCYCANNFTADSNCTECSLSCPIGYGNNSDCSQCIVSDICEADNPCQNGGTCSLDAAPNDYTCYCTNNFTADTDCTVCSLSCPTGYSNNSDCNQCIVSNICEADDPCENGGSCTLNSAPFDYSCSCINSWGDTNCTSCNHACGDGLSHNTDCSGCVLSNICEAGNPCQNGGVCNLNSPPNNYTCSCLNNWESTNCTSCNEVCNDGYTYNSVCDGCVVSDICIVDEPCKNGGTCDLLTPPYQFSCTCTNSYDPVTNCTGCALACPSGYVPNDDCSDCILENICATAANPCENGGLCSIQSGPADYRCNCDSSTFQGETCTDCVIECDPGYTINLHTCTCDLNDICVVEAPCKNGGKCIKGSLPYQYECECSNHYSGRNCTECKLECNNGNVDSYCYECICDSGYIGENCFRRDFCASTSCSGRGVCTSVYENFECDCEPGYGGAECEACDEDYELKGDECERMTDTISYEWWYIAVPVVAAVVVFVPVVVIVIGFYITHPTAPARGGVAGGGVAGREKV